MMTTALDYLHLKGTPYECCKKCDNCWKPLDKIRITVVCEAPDRDAHFTVCSRTCETACRAVRWDKIFDWTLNVPESTAPSAEPAPTSSS